MGARRARSEVGVAAPRLLLSEVSQAGAAGPGPGRAGAQGPAGLEARQEIAMARAIRAHCLACGQSAADIAVMIHSQCGPAFGTRLVRAQRLALGIALADVVAQVRARYVNEGRTAPRFSETLLSSYEGGQKRPGPEYLHYLCCVYQAEPADLGYEGPCLCGQRHRAPVLMLSGPAAAGVPRPGRSRLARRAQRCRPGRRPDRAADTHRSPQRGRSRRGGARCLPARSGRREADRDHRDAIACAGVARPGPVQSSPARSGSVRSGPVRPRPVQSGPVQSGPVQSGPVLPGAGSVQSSPVRAGPVRAGAA